jgi:hypothetical protein
VLASSGDIVGTRPGQTDFARASERITRRSQFQILSPGTEATKAKASASGRDESGDY